MTSAVRTPGCTHPGLGSFHFARRYSGNRCFFLFLRLLRCFSSPGSLPYVMNWRMDGWSLSSRVSPFRYLRINGYLLLPEAFRSLSRLSSALSAKASTLRSFLLDLCYEHLGGDKRKRRQRLTCDTCRALGENEPLVKFEPSSPVPCRYLNTLLLRHIALYLRVLCSISGT